MNVLEMLDKELQERQAYSLESKRRYLYLRLCQLFSFDSRYHNCIYELLKDKAEPLKEELRNKIINLENVNFLSTVYLFQDYDDKDWDFIDIYPVHLKDNSLYYAIRKEKNTYIFDKVDNEEANIYLKELKGKNKELFYRRQ